MKKPLLKHLAISVACVLAVKAYGLTIIPTFDVSITSNVNGIAMMNAINSALGVLQSNLTDNVTVNITFVADEGVGLGQSSTYGGNYSYSNFLAHLKSRAASVNDTNALNKLTNPTAEPVTGGTEIHLTTAQARLLGLDSYDGIDSTVSLKMSLMNFTRPLGDPGKYDLQQVVEHEVDEVLGISSGLPDTSVVWPVDLFRYTTNRIRTFTASGDDAYFSVDGTNLIARYNMDSGGDYGDWWSVANNWSPAGGIGVYPQVQDAFSGPNVALDLGVAELTALDVVGWTLPTATSSATPPTLKIVRSGVNQFTLSWTNTASGYVLQERTNLISGNWAFSATGLTNPASIASTDLTKFYRLYKPGTGSQQPASAAVLASAPHGPLTITVRNYQPRKP